MHFVTFKASLGLGSIAKLVTFPRNENCGHLADEVGCSLADICSDIDRQLFYYWCVLPRAERTIQLLDISNSPPRIVIDFLAILRLEFFIWYVYCIDISEGSCKDDSECLYCINNGDNKSRGGNAREIETGVIEFTICRLLMKNDERYLLNKLFN